MQPVVFPEKQAPVFPLIGGSASFLFVCLFFSFLGDKCGVRVVCRYQGYMIGGYPFSRSQTLHLRYGEYFPQLPALSPSGTHK